MALEAARYPPLSPTDVRTLPDWAEVGHRRPHKPVTRKLLWMEYKGSGPGGFGRQPVQAAAERMAEGLGLQVDAKTVLQRCSAFPLRQRMVAALVDDLLGKRTWYSSAMVVTIVPLNNSIFNNNSTELI